MKFDSLRVSKPCHKDLIGCLKQGDSVIWNNYDPSSTTCQTKNCPNIEANRPAFTAIWIVWKTLTRSSRILSTFYVHYRRSVRILISVDVNILPHNCQTIRYVGLRVCEHDPIIFFVGFQSKLAGDFDKNGSGKRRLHSQLDMIFLSVGFSRWYHTNRCASYFQGQQVKKELRCPQRFCRWRHSRWNLELWSCSVPWANMFRDRTSQKRRFFLLTQLVTFDTWSMLICVIPNLCIQPKTIKASRPSNLKWSEIGCFLMLG